MPKVGPHPKFQHIKGKPVSSGFGRKILENLGWKSGDGLGKDRDGITHPVHLRFKADVKGVGYKENTEAWLGNTEGFDELLKSLNGGGGQGAAGGCASLERTSSASRARLHYHKFVRSKDLSQCPKKDLEAIFGRRPDNMAQERGCTASDKFPTGACDSAAYFKERMAASRKRKKVMEFELPEPAGGLDNMGFEEASTAAPRAKRPRSSSPPTSPSASPCASPSAKKKRKKQKNRGLDNPGFEEAAAVDAGPRAGLVNLGFEEPVHQVVFSPGEDGGIANPALQLSPDDARPKKVAFSNFNEEFRERSELFEINARVLEDELWAKAETEAENEVNELISAYPRTWREDGSPAEAQLVTPEELQAHFRNSNILSIPGYGVI